MKRYRVRVEPHYYFYVEVEAENEKEAIEKSGEEPVGVISDDWWYDSEVEEELEAEETP